MTSDYLLGIERAAHEVEWMKRGYVAWLMGPIQTMADCIRTLPDTFEPTADATYSMALKDATNFIVNARDGAASDIHLHATLNQIAERLNEIPDDPLDEKHCTRRDGALPTTSRGYKAKAA